jgi:hypothetical protein
MYTFAAGAALWALPWLRMHRSLRAAEAAGGPNYAAECAAPPAQQPQQQLTQQPAPQQPAAAPAPAVGFWPLMRRKEVWAIAITQYTSAFGFFSSLAFLPAFFLDHCGVQLSQVRGGAAGSCRERRGSRRRSPATVVPRHRPTPVSSLNPPPAPSLSPPQLGGYTLAPYLVQAAVGLGAGATADHLIQRRGWDVRSVRVAMQVAAMLGPAAALTLATSPWGAHSADAAVAFITLGMGLSALNSSACCDTGGLGEGKAQGQGDASEARPRLPAPQLMPSPRRGPL